jgi:hypothetical protein
MTQDWLIKRVTIEGAEAANMHHGVAFGYGNADWAALKSQMIPGDELWEFRSPKESWAHMCGRAGICLVRDGEVIGSKLTLMN